jgi:adenosylhomocysteine/aminodeoxyfutalosine nucleosidase
MKIGIMGAMVEEIEPFLGTSNQKEPLLESFELVEKVEYGNNSYYLAKYKDLDIVLSYSKIGKVFASLTASTMIEHFGCEQIIFTGVAGAINPNLNIGDLIVATKLCQHDLDITAFGHPYGYVPEGKVYVEADKSLIELAKSVAKDKNISLKDGIIATGDQFVASKEKKDWIGETFGADALEMEGASVAVVCDALSVPFFVLRAISDSANGDAVSDFDEFLKESSKRSSNFVLSMVEKISQNETN